MNRKGKEVWDAIEKEVESWPGVTVELVEGGKHPKAKYTFEGKILSRPFAGTLSDSAFGIHRILGDQRRIMKQLGAKRSKPEPTKDEDEAPHRKPTNGASKADKISKATAPAAKAKPDIADQLVANGVVTEEEAKASAGEKIAAGLVDAIEGRGRIAAGPAPERGAFSNSVAAASIVYVPDDDEDEDEAAREKRTGEIMAQIEAIVDGVYFGLPDYIYHAVPRLSASGLQKLCVSPATFWRGSWLDPEREELDEDATKAQILGKAYHCARLEPDTFHDRYCRKPTKAKYPKALTSDAAIKATLKDLGEPQTSGATETIVERAERLVDAGYTGLIWHLIEAAYEKDRNDRVGIEEEFYDQLVTDMERMRGSEIGELLTGGAAEVSVFWTDRHGIKMKARIDYLRLSDWSDLKTFDNVQRKELEQALADRVRYDRLHVQAANYRDATEAIRVGGLDIIGEATEGQRALIYGLRTRAKPLRCYFIFQEKKGVPNILAREFEFHTAGVYRDTEIDALVEEENQDAVRDALGSATSIYSRALWEIDRAKRTFVEYSQVYEPGTPWFPIEAVGKFSDLQFNTYWLEGKA